MSDSCETDCAIQRCFAFGFFRFIQTGQQQDQKKSCHSLASSVPLYRAADAVPHKVRSNSHGKCHIPETAVPAWLPNVPVHRLTPFDKVIAAVRTGNLDLSLALGNTDFLSALGALEDPVCFVAAFLAEEAADQGSQFQKLCVFCLPACNILGKMRK